MGDIVKQGRCTWKKVKELLRPGNDYGFGSMFDKKDRPCKKGQGGRVKESEDENKISRRTWE